MSLRITNREARKLWLAGCGLLRTPAIPLDVPGIIRELGFLQIDTVRNVPRAHNHIIWSRNQKFREGNLWPLLKDRALFEHFTHDASLIPIEVYPYWAKQFGRFRSRKGWVESGLSQGFLNDIKARIIAEGPLSTHAFSSKIDGKREMWARPPHKKALEQMWYRGELTTGYREGFVKFYDLAERAIPDDMYKRRVPEPTQLNWLLDQAMARLGFATAAELQRFWDATTRAEVNGWVGQGNTIPVEIETADGGYYAAHGVHDIESRMAKLPEPTGPLRLLNPFDPLIRDRARIERLFGFIYRNEMFVPKAKRVWGYYVYPLLEGTRFVGRIEIKADRVQDHLSVIGFWPEQGVVWGVGRVQKLTSELARFARLSGVKNVTWKNGVTCTG